jgi:hypothetical protein
MDWTLIAGPLLKLGLTGLGTAFGGPLGGTIGGALGSAIAGALGTAPTPEAVGAALQSTDPEAVKAKLADLESARQTELADLQARLVDVQDARHQTIALAQAGSDIAWAPVVVSSLILFVVVGVVAAVAYGKLPDNGIVVGWALASGTLVLNYWLGSSSGSRRMGDAVRTIAAQSAGTAVADAAGRAIGSAIKRAVK